MTMGQFRCAAAAWGLSAALVASALAGQPPTKPADKPGTPATPAAKTPDAPGDGKPKGLDSIQHPGQRLGVRVNVIERQFSIIPTVVIVPDEASFLAALSGWRTTDTFVRYPILIDDMTWSSRMRIAQFVRAFKPKTVVRWKVGGAEANLPPDPTEAQGRIESVVAGIWGAPSAAGLKKVWDDKRFVPPGVVVCSLKDPAWTAGVTLAAFHGEPILWVDPPECPDPTGYLVLAQADDYNARIMKALDATGWQWNKLGDDIDAVTLCATTPSRAWLGPHDAFADELGWTTSLPARTERRYLAVTDVVGRLPKAPPKPIVPGPGGPGAPGSPGAPTKSGASGQPQAPAAFDPDAPKPPPPVRWAWCGQIMGSSSRAAYDAMCAVFLQPERAWLFDGYEAKDRWNDFDMTRAATPLERIGITSLLDDAPSGKGLSEFRARAAGPNAGAGEGMGLDVGLIAINTKGNADFFDLSPGQGKPVDAPILRRPAMVYMVHSFSAMQPTSRMTVGGVWLDRGAYAYLGSVDEPYLQAFVPTPEAMQRIAGGMIWGAAVRPDGFEPWKLAVLGDPLITFGPLGPRTDAIALPLTGAEDISSKLPGQLQTKNYLDALWTLVLTGRDKDASRLLAAISRDPKQLTTEVALAGVTSAFFAGDYQTFLAVADKTKPAVRDPQRSQRDGLGAIRDMVWQAIWPHAYQPTREEADLLGDMVRPENQARDVEELKAIMARLPR
jgi:hypothetical protein